MPINKRQLGTNKEDYACKYLEEKGYIIKERNFRYKHGEIDIIAFKDDELIFIEVKYRSSDRYGMPYEAVDYRKKQRIINASRFYMAINNIYDSQIRYDVISILNDEISHYENAFNS